MPRNPRPTPAPSPPPSSSEELALLLQLVELAGDQLSEPETEEAKALLRVARTDPVQFTVKFLQVRRSEQVAKRSCAKAREAVEQLSGTLESLLAPANPLLCRLEGLRFVDDGPGNDGGNGRNRGNGRRGARATCRIQGQLRELRVHESVSLEDLEALEPWDYVLVHPDQMIVIGTSRHPDQLARARGEIVEFRAYFDEDRHQAWVARAGHADEIVTLARRLREVELTPSDRLVLLHEDERYAIDRVEAEHVRSRFEMPIDQLDTRLEDLAGLDDIVDPLLEDVCLRLLNPEVSTRYALEPLRGLLLVSFKPGMGKTALMRALASFLDDLGREQGFDVVLYVVRPNELKIVWHGGDAKLVREELCGAIRARQALPRTRPLFQIVVMDEIDSLGKRGGMNGELVSAASNDAVQALLAEMDGMVQPRAASANGKPPAHVLWCGLTNRPDMLDEALKRPGRFGDFVREMPAADEDAAARILAIHGRGESIPWELDREIRDGLGAEELRSRITRPAIEAVFDQVVLRYSTDRRTDVDVTAGEAMASVHFKEAMKIAKSRAARRDLDGIGVPAVTLDDVVEGLVEQACAAAGQLEADREMFRRQMKIAERVTRMTLVPVEELSAHRYFLPTN